MLLSCCCDAPGWLDSTEKEDGICSDCYEHSEFYDDEEDKIEFDMEEDIR